MNRKRTWKNLNLSGDVFVRFSTRFRVPFMFKTRHMDPPALGSFQHSFDLLAQKNWVGTVPWGKNLTNGTRLRLRKHAALGQTHIWRKLGVAVAGVWCFQSWHVRLAGPDLHCTGQWMPGQDAGALAETAWAHQSSNLATLDGFNHTWEPWPSAS